MHDGHVGFTFPRTAQVEYETDFRTQAGRFSRNSDPLRNERNYQLDSGLDTDPLLTPASNANTESV